MNRLPCLSQQRVRAVAEDIPRWEPEGSPSRQTDGNKRSRSSHPTDFSPECNRLPLSAGLTKRKTFAPHLPARAAPQRHNRRAARSHLAATRSSCTDLIRWERDGSRRDRRLLEAAETSHRRRRRAGTGLMFRVALDLRVVRLNLHLPLRCGAWVSWLTEVPHLNGVLPLFR